jgi:hypothetical protein
MSAGVSKNTGNGSTLTGAFCLFLLADDRRVLSIDRIQTFEGALEIISFVRLFTGEVRGKVKVVKMSCNSHTSFFFFAEW